MENFDNLKERKGFAGKLAERFNTKQKDAEALKPKKINMSEINDFEFPGKLNMISQPGKVSVRPSKVNENNLHGGEGKNMVKENTELVD